MPSNRPSKFSIWFRTNQALGAALSAFLLVLFGYVLLSPWMFRPQRDGFLLGFIPAVALGLMILLTLLLVFDAQRNSLAREGSEADINVNGSTLLFALAVLIVTGLYFGAVLLAGFILVTPAFLFATAHLLGARPWPVAFVFGLIMTALVYLMFLALNTSLPAGVLFS